MHPPSSLPAFVGAISLVVSIAGGCATSSPTRDADAGCSDPCSEDRECDDGLFCNGAEVCMPDAECGGLCAAGVPACVEGERCDEDARECTSGCADDEDGDGFISIACGGTDCDDDDARRSPGQTEVCDAEGIDEDCDERTLGDDADRDGFVSDACCQLTASGLTCGRDCDDGLAGVSPGDPEACNGLDDDCDGEVDEQLLVTIYRDFDGDGAGDPETSLEVCSLIEGYVSSPNDCDDLDPGRNPGATEICDGVVDDNCDSAVDEGCGCVDERMRPCVGGPRDGFGACRGGMQRCDDGVWGACEGAVIPEAESCNGVDDDCDGFTDELVTVVYYRDADGDGHGVDCDPDCTPEQRQAACGEPDGWTLSDNDCDDGDPAIRPGEAEICDEVDNNCNGVADEGVTTDYYLDVDGDGYGVGAAIPRCGPDGVTRATVDGDCDDADDTRHPTRVELCNGVDDNCDTLGDELFCECITGTPRPCGNATGDCRQGVETCDALGTWPGVCIGDVRPATEVCGGGDEDCDGETDEDGAMDATLWYRDGDHDGFGDANVSERSCAQPMNYVDNDRDCYDDNPAVFPGQTDFFTSQRGDGSFDYNCNGLTDPFYPNVGSVVGTCVIDGFGCSPPDTGWADGSLAACGSTRQYVTGCGGYPLCGDTTITRQQRCR